MAYFIKRTFRKSGFLEKADPGPLQKADPMPNFEDADFKYGSTFSNLQLKIPKSGNFGPKFDFFCLFLFCTLFCISAKRC